MPAMFETARPFLLALAIGLVIGIERERAHGDAAAQPLGARTFTLLALLGALAAHLESPGLAVVMALFVAAAAVASYLRPASEDERRNRGLTTEVAAMATFGLGYLAHEQIVLSAMLGVLMLLVLALKPSIHELAHEGLSPQETRAALSFLVIACVVLPLLPNRTVDPWEIVNPFKLWLLFVTVVAISFAGYIAVRALGPSRGLAISGLFAGMVSSTAATLSLSRTGKESPDLGPVLSIGILLANVASATAQIIIVGIANPNLVGPASTVIGAPIAVGLVGAALAGSLRRPHPSEATSGARVSLGNPLAIRPAAKVAAMFAAFLIVAKVAERAFGASGVMAMAALGGSTDVHAVTLAVSTLAVAGDVQVPGALAAIVLAFLCNMIVKIGIVVWVGGRRLAWRAAPPLVAMMAAAAAALLMVRGRY